ncbi:MAG: type II secretion system F family protein, partial [Halarsenatibacteraceae bacterium]
MSPEFNYQARRKNGELVGGELNAGGRDEVARQLRERGMYIVSIEQKDAEESGGLFGSLSMDLEDLMVWKHGFKIADLAHFSQQLSVLIGAGIPLVSALGMMKEQASEKHVKEMLTEVVNSVEAGEPFSAALKSHPDYFPPLFLHLVKAGETGGVLDDILEELVDYYRRRDKINKEVKASLYYPVVIVFVAIVAVFILMGFVLPTITDMLLSFGGSMPLPTKILIGVSNFIASFWWAIILAGIVFILGLRAYIKSPSGKKKKDRLLLKLPVIGDLLMKIIIARFASTMALLLRSGVNIINALPVIEDVVNNDVYEEILQETRARVREGVVMSEPLDNSGEFPPMVIQMIRTGEESGNLEDMLNRTSDFYDIEVQNAIDGSISLIEPVMIIIMAVVVGSI